MEQISAFRTAALMKSDVSLTPYTDRLRNGAVTKDDLRYERDIILELYKHHLKLLLEANVFVYAVTGALLSFVVTHLTVPHIRWVLVFPAVFDVAFAVFFWIAGIGIDNSQEELELITIALHANVYQKLAPLRLGLWVSSIALTFVVLLIGFGAYWISP
jgi:hypothetical protein